MTHLYYGDPSPEFSIRLAKTLIESGADVLEIGIPYTDPICDGEVFQRACTRSLRNGTTPYDVLDGIKQLTLYQSKHGTGQAIYLTSYYGPIYKIGVPKFVKKAQEARIKGLIVPDILLEEQSELSTACRQQGLSLIQFATVYSTRERLKKIIAASTDPPCRQAGFIYCTALPGVTGDRIQKGRLFKSLRLLKSLTAKKIFVGFGISSPSDVKEIMEMGADGVIVGSAIARRYEQHITHPEKTLPEIADFVRGIKDSTI